MLGSVLCAITASFFGLAMSHSSDEEICPESDKLSVYNMSNGTLDFMCENRDDCNNATVIIGKNTHSVFFGFSGRDSGANSMYSFKDVVAEIECSGRGSCAYVVLELLGETLFGDASDSGDGRRRMQDSGGMTCTGKDACNDMEVAVSDTAEFTLNCPETGDDAGCRGITVEASDNAKVSVAIEDAEVAQTMTVTTIGDDAVCTNCEESGVTVVEVEVTTTTATTTTDDNGGGNGGGDDDMTTTQLEMTTTGDDSVDMTTTGGGGGGSGSGSGSGEDTTAAPGPSEDQDDGDAAYRNNFSLFSLLFLTFVVSFVVFY